MSVGSVSSGANLAAEVMRLVDELGRDLQQNHREEARDAAALALQKGREEASEIREQAGTVATGAFINGGCTLVGAGLQWEGAGAEGMKGARLRLLGDSFVKIGQSAADASNALAEFDKADAHEAAGEAQAAMQRARSEQDEAAAARAIVNRARDTYASILTAEQASLMAAQRA